jgi:predicted transcriptional regulator
MSTSQHSHTNTGITTANRDRALKLLGQGINPLQVADALGISASSVSQYISDPEFSREVAELRFKNLSKHNDRDDKYDDMEDTLLDKLQDLVPYMMRPMEILKAIATINAAKRRGATAPIDPAANQSTVINLTMPVQVIQQFVVNSANQVIKAGNQELTTVQSGNMKKLLEEKAARISNHDQSIQTVP